MIEGKCLCGACGWTLQGDPGPVTACNCSACGRFGALWAYDVEGGRIVLWGETRTFTRPGKANPALEFHFCPTCGCVTSWRGLRLEDGERRLAFNVRLAPLEAVGEQEIDHFDGHDTFEDLPRDGRRVRDLWF